MAPEHSHGLKHPLERFSAGRGPVGEGTACRRQFGETILQAVLDTARYGARHPIGNAARRFLLRDTEDFPWMCELAGIDSEKLRAHLQRIECGDIPSELLD
jgi:hypothetical protein